MIKLKYSKINDEPKHQSNHVNSTLKVANFNLNIKQSSHTCRRYSQQQKIMSRRQIINPPFPQNQLFRKSNLLNIPKSKESQIGAQKKEFKCFNPQYESYSPTIRDKIFQLRVFINRNAQQNKKKTQQHNINFTQLAVLQQKPKTTTVLHSRIRKQCPYQRASQTRVVANNTKIMKRSTTSCDNFNSIQVNSKGKYGSTVKLGPSEGKLQNKQIIRIKKKLQRQLIQRSYSQRKKTSRSANGTGPSERYQNDYQPWQIKKLDSNQELFVFEE